MDTNAGVGLVVVSVDDSTLISDQVEHSVRTTVDLIAQRHNFSKSKIRRINVDWSSEEWIPNYCIIDPGWRYCN